MVESLNRCSLPGVGVLNRAPTLEEYQIAEMASADVMVNQREPGGWLRWHRLRAVCRMKPWADAANPGDNTQRLYRAP